MMRPRTGQQSQEKLQDRKQELAIAVGHRRDEAMGVLGSHVTAVVDTGSEVNELAL